MKCSTLILTMLLAVLSAACAASVPRTATAMRRMLETTPEASRAPIMRHMHDTLPQASHTLMRHILMTQPQTARSHQTGWILPIVPTNA